MSEGPAKSVVDAFNQLALQAAQGAATVHQNALDASQNFHSASMSNLLQFQQQAGLLFLQSAARSSEVAQAYQGNHLRRGSEVDAQEGTAEGAVYKGESLASMPQTQAQHASLYHDQVVKSVTDAVVAQVLTKLAQTTPPQTGGHAAEAPSGLK